MDATWQNDDESVRLYLGDCRDVLPFVSGVTAFVTDPPYSIQNEFGTQERLDGTRALQWAWDNECTVEAVVERVRLGLEKVNCDGAFVVFCGSDQVGELVKAFRDFDFTPKMLTWVKKCPPPACPGNWWPSAFELGFYGYRSGAYFGDKDTKRNNVFLFDSYRHGQPGKVDHPTQKPLALMERLVTGVCPQGSTVLDAFMGSGTTGVACVRHGRKFIGIERDPKFFELSKRRIQEAMGQEVKGKDGMTQRRMFAEAQ